MLSLIVVFGLIYIFEIGPAGGDWRILFKLIPMFFIILLALTTKTEGITKYHALIVCGLIFCAIGDYTLQWFIIGLSFFLVGHIFYIAAFYQANIKKAPKYVLYTLILFGLIISVIIPVGLLKDGDIVLAICVLSYICVILTMGWSSFRTGGNFSIIGACLFIISDTVLALNKFTVDIPLSSEIIMFTYYGAQVFIALSVSQYSAIRNKVIQ